MPCLYSLCFFSAKAETPKGMKNINNNDVTKPYKSFFEIPKCNFKDLIDISNLNIFGNLLRLAIRSLINF